MADSGILDYRGPNGLWRPGCSTRTRARAVIGLAPGRLLRTIRAEAPSGRVRLALASTCVDLRITQVANQAWGVHAVLAAGVMHVPGQPG